MQEAHFTPDFIGCGLAIARERDAQARQQRQHFAQRLARHARGKAC
jgi:hypothetical protein